MPSAPELHGQPGIQIAISVDRSSEIRDSMLIMRIGGRAFNLSSVTDRDRHQITLGYGSGERQAWRLGRLNKGQLEQ